MAKEKDPKTMAARMARYMGCSGVHQNEDGIWMPCKSREELLRRSNAAEPRKKSLPDMPKKRKLRRRRGENWEKLRERGVLGIATLPGGGLVSGTGVGGKAVKDFLYGRAKPRLGDPDVFTSPVTARLRARQLGCIGIARRETPDGDVVWTPCTNVSDYRRRTGVGVQARRDREREERRLMRRIRQSTQLKNDEVFDNDNDGPIMDQTVKTELESLYDIHSKLSDPEFVQVKKVRKARSDRAAATPALPSERITGSSKNPKGSAASSSSGSSITLDDAAIQGLKNKVREHNEKMRKLGKPQSSMVSLGRLKSVWRRGAGAFSSSHRPGMTRSRWAFARVNAFLYLLEKGKPRNSRYTTDNDLLPKGHPLKSRKVSSKSLSSSI